MLKTVLQLRILLLLLFLTLLAGVLYVAWPGTSASELSIVAAAELPQPEPPESLFGDSVRPLSERIVEYRISVQLHPDQGMLRGEEQLIWRNPGSAPVSEMHLHMYANAFRSAKTTFMRESGGKLRNDRMEPNRFGWIDILSLQTADGVDLSSGATYIQPDDGNKHDMTLMKVPLPKAVQPGETVTLNIGFAVKLPFAFARMGIAEDFVMAGQWFPKVAVYEPEGTRGRENEGWSLHQYHGNSEFYANFGVYHVKIKTPPDYTVAATGFPAMPPEQSADGKTYFYYADDVHDFAWAASPSLLYFEQPFSTPQIPWVKLKLYIDPKHVHLRDRYFAAAKKSLARYSEWFGTYPYSTLSIVIPPEAANGAGGMEYPTLITGWGAGEEDPDYSLEQVIVHEIGHQFWYGMLASNEFEEAWLDEGFTSFAEDWVMESEYGVKPNYALESSYVTSPAPLNWLSWQFGSHDTYAENVYIRAKLVLVAIEREIGRAQMSRVLRTYFDRWKFKHPSSQDFEYVLGQVTGKDWSDFFNQFVYSGNMIDYEVSRIQTRSVQSAGQTEYENSVVITRNGTAYSGTVPIYFRFEDGTVRKEQWNGTAAGTQFKLLHPSRLSWVAIDPHHTMVLENKRNNNFMNADIVPQWKTRWNIGTAQLLELWLSWIVM